MRARHWRFGHLAGDFLPRRWERLWRLGYDLCSLRIQLQVLDHGFFGGLTALPLRLDDLNQPLV